MDNMRKIAIMGKVFSDAKDVYVDIKIHDFEFNTLKIIPQASYFRTLPSLISSRYFKRAG